jgi:hypothetical protein
LFRGNYIYYSERSTSIGHGTFCDTSFPRFLLMLSNFQDTVFPGGRHGLVHAFGLGTFY